MTQSFNIGMKEALSYTSLKEALISPLDFWLYVTGQKKRETESLKFGGAYDCLLFERDKFHDRYIVLDDAEIVQEILLTYPEDKRASASPRATKKYKEWLDDFNKKSMGKVLLSSEEGQVIQEMMSMMEATGVRDRYLSGGATQEDFKCEIHGLPVYGRIDYRSALMGVVREFKTTGKHVANFYKDARYTYHYDLQAYIYQMAFKLEMQFVVQSKLRPYEIGVFEVSDEFLESGEQKFLKAKAVIETHFRKGAETDLKKYYLKSIL